MKTTHKWLLSIAILSSICITGQTLHADDDDHGPPREHDGDNGPAHPDEQPAPNHPGTPAHVSLEREMRAMSHAYRTIRSQVKDPTKNAATLAAVLELEQHTLASKSATPGVATTQPTAAKNADTKTAYQLQMVTLLRQELDLEDALLANDNDKAIKAAAALHGLEEQGHKDFRPRDDD